MLVKRGARGWPVRSIQRVCGCASVDGVFGAGTEAAVKAWQSAHGLDPDGAVGDVTLAAMFPPLSLDPHTPAGFRVQRARSAKGTATYKLGCGGYDPTDPTPADAQGRCDCSGFVAWAHGVSRDPHRRPINFPRWPWWFSTDSVWTDIRTANVFFDRVDPADVQPGDVVVYPDHDGKQGHIALVTDPRLYMVVECGIRSSVRRAHPDWPALGEREREDMFLNPRREFGRFKH